jgi:serine/threonine protein kinase
LLEPPNNSQRSEIIKYITCSQRKLENMRFWSREKQEHHRGNTCLYGPRLVFIFPKSFYLETIITMMMVVMTELLENRSYNKSVDVYAFGIVFWELLTHSIPFKQLSIADIRDRVLSGSRPPTNYACITGRNLRLINSCW